MKRIPDESIDAIICDLPYNTTSNEWDTLIPIEKLWAEYQRIIKKRGNILLFGQSPFSEKIIFAVPHFYRYKLIWVKDIAIGFLNSKVAPLRTYEEVMVFNCHMTQSLNTTNLFKELKEYLINEKRAANLSGEKLKNIFGNQMASHYFTNGSQFVLIPENQYLKLQSLTNRFTKPYKEILTLYAKERPLPQPQLPITYNPQGLIKIHKEIKKPPMDGCYKVGAKHYTREYTNYPMDVLYFPHDTDRFHPTQKSVSLLEYLIRTYTNEGDLILDNCMGSGTTAVAALRNKRNFIGFELNYDYYQKAIKRIELEKINESSKLF